MIPGTPFPKFPERPPGHGGDTIELCSLRFQGAGSDKCFIHWTGFLRSTHPLWNCILSPRYLSAPTCTRFGQRFHREKRDDPKLQQCGEEARPRRAWRDEELTVGRMSHISKDTVCSAPVEQVEWFTSCLAQHPCSETLHCSTCWSQTHILQP